MHLSVSKPTRRAPIDGVSAATDVLAPALARFLLDGGGNPWALAAATRSRTRLLSYSSGNPFTPQQCGVVANGRTLATFAADGDPTLVFDTFDLRQIPTVQCRQVLNFQWIEDAPIHHITLHNSAVKHDMVSEINRLRYGNFRRNGVMVKESTLGGNHKADTSE